MQFWKDKHSTTNKEQVVNNTLLMINTVFFSLTERDIIHPEICKENLESDLYNFFFFFLFFRLILIKLKSNDKLMEV